MYLSVCLLCCILCSHQSSFLDFPTSSLLPFPHLSFVFVLQEEEEVEKCALGDTEADHIQTQADNSQPEGDYTQLSEVVQEKKNVYLIIFLVGFIVFYEGP